MKKALLVLMAASLLTACGNEKKEEQIPTQPEVSEENQIEPQTETIKEEEQPIEEPIEEPVEEEVKSSQVIQSQPGENQKEDYFAWETDDGIYKQTGDAFITNSKYDDSKILVIPINFTNKKQDTADPWMTFIFDFKMYQEDENQEYVLNGGQGSVSDEYTSPINMNIKPGGSVDYYITYTLELPEADVKITPQFGNGGYYTFIQQ